MKYKIWDMQLNKYSFDEYIFKNKKEAVDQLISFFSVDCDGDLTKIRAELWEGGEFSDLIIEAVKEIYPEELTERESEEYDFKRFDDSDSYKEDYKEAVKYAKKTKGQVYTMVDGENNKTYYLKGLHYVNRFGFCVLRVVEK